MVKTILLGYAQIIIEMWKGKKKARPKKEKKNTVKWRWQRQDPDEQTHSHAETQMGSHLGLRFIFFPGKAVT